MFRSGDILYGKLRPYLDKAVLVEFQGLCSTDILVLKTKGTIMPQFLVNIIHTGQFLNHAVSTTKGVNHPRTSYSSLSAFQFLLPPLPEQRAISRVLRVVQQAREARLREIALERERKAALMEHLFRHGTRGEATKETEIGEMPESWEVLRLGDAITLHRGFDLPQKDRLPGNVPIISSSGITGTHAKAKIKGPGVVTGRYGTIGEVFYISQDFWPLNTTLFVSEFNGNYPLFILYFLQTIKLSSFNDKR